MNKENIYQPFEIVYKTMDECPKEGHKHLFFELVYIISGTGIQCINQNKFEYHAGHMFLITPEDCHSFEIETTTEFFFLKFTDIYIKSKAFQSEDIERLEYILSNANHQPGCILKNLSDKSLVKPITEAIIREYVNRDLYNRELIQQLVNTLIVVVARNIAKYMPADISEKTDEKALDILNYIQKNIYSPENLRTDVMSNYFGISETYLGKYFKKHTNETIQQYTANHRITLIEARLKFSDKRINEIAAEFGFTDDSHFNKFFRKQKGISPSGFRKALIKKAVAIEA
ncbi:helix-turn-helix domain-containing protein [Flavobacterium zepuense]|uniref:Helix-turn-helix domain-containing protein n=1 Tax=Flavobacterium zepuense TaxID=2593302 RepID=A0A552UV06_9FLAO|nr:AraC family transcriptional regulator [Flavobacterium zepuense]TRW22029.1 helix-turn-helix domain-containing protein [Flavobacterium zepuense]